MDDGALHDQMPDHDFVVPAGTRGFVVVARDGRLTVRERGLYLVRHAFEDGEACFLGDYPLPDLTHLARQVVERGCEALAGMPGNTLAFVLRGRASGSPELVIARDILGNAPLYVAHIDPHTQVAVSTPTLLRQFGAAFTFAVDTGVLDQYLAYRHVSGPETLLRGVQRPLNGHALVFRDGHSEHLRYFDMRATFGAGDFQAAADRVASTLRTSLAREEHFDTLGLMFSGGMDSSWLAYAGRRADMRLYTIRMPGVAAHDWASAQSEAAAMGKSLQEVRLERAGYAERLPQAILAHGWPIDHPNYVSRDVLFEQAMRDGIGRLVSGDGADMIFGGSAHVSLSKALAVKRFLPRFARHLPAFGRRLTQIRRTLSESVENLILNSKAYYPQDQAMALLGAHGDPARQLRHHLADAVGLDPVDCVFYLSFLSDVSVAQSGQRAMAWHHGVDVGYPYLDLEMVRLANSVRGRDKVAGFTSKRLFARASREVLPARVIDRPKCGLPVPLEDFITGSDGLLRYRPLLEAPDAGISPLLLRAPLLALLERLATGRHSPVDLELYWVVVNLELWLRLVVRGESLD